MWAGLGGRQTPEGEAARLAGTPVVPRADGGGCHPGGQSGTFSLQSLRWMVWELCFPHGSLYITVLCLSPLHCGTPQPQGRLTPVSTSKVSDHWSLLPGCTIRKQDGVLWVGSSMIGLPLLSSSSLLPKSCFVN